MAKKQVKRSSMSLAIRSDQISRSVVSDSLWPHESQHARPPCPSPTPGLHSNSRPLSMWCHSAISSSVVPFSSCPQALPASESFPMSQLFAWGGQSTGVSTLASFPPKNTQDWSPLEWTGLISLLSINYLSETLLQKIETWISEYLLEYELYHKVPSAPHSGILTFHQLSRNFLPCAKCQDPTEK